MPNTLTGLIPIIYEGLDVVSRELIGFIPNVSRDATAATAAVGQTVRSPVVPAMSAADITPSNVSSTGDDRGLSFVDLTITKSRKVSFHLTGEQEVSLGSNNTSVARDSFAQAFRTLANEMEVDLAGLYVSASRAYGTAGSTPFATAADLSDLAQVNRILDENGAPPTNRTMIVGSDARANLEGKHSELFKVNESGDAGALLRNRQMRQLQGFTMGFSAQVRSVTKGTGASYLVNNASGIAVGGTTIAADTGSGTILAGDIVTFAADTANKYVVGTALSAGSFALNAPGARRTIPDNNAITVGNNYVANLAYSSNAIVLATRLPAVPSGGDNADDRMTVVDPISGLSFEIAVYRQYRQVSYEVGIAWGVKAVKPEHMAILIG